MWPVYPFNCSLRAVNAGVIQGGERLNEVEAVVQSMCKAPGGFAECAYKNYKDQAGGAEQ